MIAPKQEAIKNPKTKKEEKPKEEEKKEDDIFDEFSKCDFWVGVMTKCWRKEGSEKLYCEEIEVGEPSVWPIASGLQ